MIPLGLGGQKRVGFVGLDLAYFGKIGTRARPDSQEAGGSRKDLNIRPGKRGGRPGGCRWSNFWTQAGSGRR